MAAVFDDEVFDHVGARAGIDADAAHVDASGLAGAVFVDFQDVSAFDQHHVADRAVHGSGQFGMQLELAVFAVDRDEILRPHQVDDELQFFLAGVSADVHRRVRAVVVDDVRFAAEQVVHHAEDGFFVAGDDARRQYDGVALFDFGVLVVVHRRPRQRRHGLALRAADEDADFLGREVLHFAGMNQHAFGDLDITQVFGDLGGILHGAADETDFAAVLARHVDGQLDAVNRRREAGDEQAPLGAGKHFFELAAHGAFARRVALALDVGGILQQRQHSFFAILGETVQIEEAVVGRRWIDLEVAGMQHDAERRVDGERNAIDQAVRDLQRMNRERPDLEAFSGTDLAQVGVVEELVFVELVFDVGQRELGAPDGNVQFAENPGQGADVVFVAVGEHDAAHMLAIFEQVRNVGDDDVDAQQLGFGEHQAGVDHDDVIAAADGHAVHTELAHPAQRNNMQFSCWH